MFGKIVSTYLLKAYGAAYPDVAESEYLKSGTGWLIADMARRCVGEIGTLFSVAESLALPAEGIFVSDPTAGTLGRRLTENTPMGNFPLPVFIAQGDNDDLVLPSVQDGFVRDLCASGQAVQYRKYPGLDHLSLVAAHSLLEQDLMQWTKARFAGEAWPSGC